MSIQNISLHVERPNLSADPANQINAFRQQLNILGDSSAKDENKLKAAKTNDHVCKATLQDVFKQLQGREVAQESWWSEVWSEPDWVYK